MDYSLVSIIIPIYNVSPYISKCASSLFMQTYRDLEFIFVNDCTPDNSIEKLTNVINEFPDRKDQVRIINHNQNMGLASARNTGLSFANGTYIFHCDSDDWIEPSAISEMVSKIVSDKAEIVYTDFYFSYANRDILSVQQKISNAEEFIKLMFKEEVHGAIWNKLYKKSLFSDNDINFPNGNDMWEDLYTNFYLFYFSNKISYLNSSFYHYNQENISSLGREINSKKLTSIFSNISQIESFLKKQQDERFTTELIYLKLAAKQTLLFTCDIKNFKKWLTTYPETNSYILSYKSLPIHLRLLGFMTTKKLWIFIRFWILVKKNLKPQ